MVDFLPAAIISGPTDAPWLVLSNSLAADVSLWDPQIAFLTTKYRILRYDTRGHGASATPAGPYSFSDLVGDVLRLLDKYQIEKAVFMGISLGGMTGLGLALDHPDRVTRLVCCDARADAPAPFVKMWSERIENVRREGLDASVEGTIERWLNAEFRASNSTEVEAVRRMILTTRIEGYIGCASALLSLNYLSRLSDMIPPTLYVVGGEDLATPPSTMEEMAKRTPGSVYRFIPGAAHLSNLDSAEGFAKAVGPFLGIPT